MHYSPSLSDTVLSLMWERQEPSNHLLQAPKSHTVKNDQVLPEHCSETKKGQALYNCSIKSTEAANLCLSVAGIRCLDRRADIKKENIV